MSTGLERDKAVNTWLDQNTQLWDSRVWYDAIEFLDSDEDVVQTKYKKKAEWLWEFLPTPERATKSPRITSRFPASRKMFMDDPSLTVEQLRSFGKDFRIQQWTMQVLTEENSPFAPGFRHIFVKLMVVKTFQFHILMEESPIEPSICPTPNDADLLAKATINTQMQLYQEDHAAQKIPTRCKGKLIENPLQLVLQDVGIRWSLGYLSSLINRFICIVKGHKYHNAYRTFAENVGEFVELVTGQADGVSTTSDPTVQVQSFLKQLHKYGVVRSKLLDPLYIEIGDLSATIEKQRQVITALAYRHLMEHLPDRDYYDNLVPNSKKSKKLRESDYWKKLWEDMVKQELQHMLGNDYGSRDLTSLFEYPFNEWRKENKAETEIPREIYTKWPTYIRGETLYDELSNNIHRYKNKGDGKSAFEVYDTNWSITDRTILNALQPKHSLSEIGNTNEDNK
ncbi:hypothetical protein F4680DRAFT_448397 [Xylaria scruposa]|nr:hypothetical protein F4680DRAFT_448397 [Xylaria scruposa]